MTQRLGHRCARRSSCQAEIFCGTAGLTQQLKNFDLPSCFGIDRSLKDKPKACVVRLDLTKPSDQALAEKWVHHPQCLGAHFGVPCGASLRTGAQALRTDQHPDGVPGLPVHLQAHVAAANCLCQWMARLILMLEAAKKVWVVENPWSSRLWDTSMWKKVTSHCSVHFAKADVCMFGGFRNKRTALAASHFGIMRMHVECDGRHEHLPWTLTSPGFDTAKAAEYTLEFCKVLARTMWRMAEMQRLVPALGEIMLARPNENQLAKSSVGVQPKASKAVPLVNEYKQVLHRIAQSHDNLPLSSKHTLTAEWTDASQKTTPAGAKLLRCTRKGGGEVASDPKANFVQAHDCRLGSHCRGGK